jgi:hypothetical protein
MKKQLQKSETRKINEKTRKPKKKFFHVFERKSIEKIETAMLLYKGCVGD